MSTIELQAYDIFKHYFKKDEDARIVIDFIEQKSRDVINSKELATKSDLNEVSLRLELKIEQTKSDMLKWFIGLFITLFLMILGLYATILLK